MHRRRLTLVALLLLLGAAQAQAQTTTPTTPTTPSTSTFTNADFQLQFQKRLVDAKGNESWVVLPDIEAKYYFNKARCECKTPIRILVDPSGAGIQKRGLVGMQGGPSALGNLQLWVGPSGCLDATKSVRETSHCTDVGAMDGNMEPVLPTLWLNSRPGAWTVQTTIDKLFAANGNAPGNGNDSGDICDRQFQQKVWLWLPSAQGDSPVLANDQAPQLNVAIDGAPPPPPTVTSVSPGNEALNISWAALMGVADLGGYVVFCSRSGLPVFTPSYYKGTEFHTPQTECKMIDQTTWGTGGVPTRASMDASAPDGGTSDAGTAGPQDRSNETMVINAPPEIRNVNTAYACSPLLTSATSYRLRTLQNEIPYVVGVASVDFTGNVSRIESGFIKHPVLTRDFYTAYRNDGGTAEGGFCAYARRGRPVGWALGATGVLLALGLRRRRRP
jgi:hypothetical protein